MDLPEYEGSTVFASHLEYSICCAERKEEIFKRVFDICFVKLTNLTDDAMIGKNQAVGEQLL